MSQFSLNSSFATNVADRNKNSLKLDDYLQTDGSVTAEEIKNTELFKAYKPNDELREGDNIELSPGGVLDEETIARGMSNLGQSANGYYQVYLNVAVPGFSITDITLLSEYKQLQKVDISYNDIRDLSPLGELKYLVFLDASHNKIKKLLDFKPPVNLQEVNLSWNKIKCMTNLSAYLVLEKLILDNNSINSICGLNNCKCLKHLSLAHNLINEIQGLNDLPIQHLNLSNNKIQRISNLESLEYLRELDLSENRIRSLAGLGCNILLESLNVEKNEILDIVEVYHITNAYNLRDLNLLYNPVEELPDFRLYILFRISQLSILDRQNVKEKEKVSAVNMFIPPKEVLAAQDHIMHVVYSFLQPSRIRDCTLPNIETPYPILVLVGPQGSGKKDLALKLVQEFGDYFGFGMLHTTRKPGFNEVAGRDYHFVSLEKFEADIKMGQFILTYQYGNTFYGLQMESIESVAREGLACVVHLEIEGTVTLKNSYFEPRYVLITPLDVEGHEKRLRDRDTYTEEEIDRSLKRVEMYIKYNQDHPGYFDTMICSDDVTEAYKHLCKLVMDYLGISSAPSSSKAWPPSTSETKKAMEEPLPRVAGEASSNQMGARTWSKRSVLDSIFRSQDSRLGSSITGRGIVEKESVQRRYISTKDTVTGHAVPLFEQIVYSRTTPQNVEGQVGIGENCKRAYSAPVNKCALGGIAEPDIPASLDSFSIDRSSSTNLSDLDSATELYQNRGGKVNKNENFKDLLPTEKVNPLALINQSGYQSASKIQLSVPFSPPISKPDSNKVAVRPGSNKHAVLPPIQKVVALS